MKGISHSRMPFYRIQVKSCEIRDLVTICLVGLSAGFLSGVVYITKEIMRKM